VLGAPGSGRGTQCERIAKDYAGAATLVPYFTLCVGTVMLMRL
jgi:hypothetical protein